MFVKLQNPCSQGECKGKKRQNRSRASSLYWAIALLLAGKGNAGLGAAGSHAAEAMARCGIGTLRLVDFDIIRESNIYRQLPALITGIVYPGFKCL